MTATEKSTDGGIVLDDIPVSLDLAAVLKRLKLRKESERIREIILELISTVGSLARPKVLYKVSQANSLNRKAFEIDGVEFASYVPTLNFEEGEQVFPYVATCGTEVDALKIPTSDLMKHFCLSVIKEMVLRSTSKYFEEYLVDHHELTQITRIGPGEALGPVAQQQQLFSVLGDVEKSIGVRLSPHNLMVPEKSSSGLFFETAIKLESCQLCPDTKCKGRSAPYDPVVLKKYRTKA
ncbi:hypothetical protein ACFLUP_03105 [Chloroflexota bacterium]